MAYKIERFFNTTGPVDCERHYCLPPLSRFDLEDVLRLIDQQKYFVLHAPRQTGKTSCLLALMKYLNEQGRYTALYVNVENAQAAREQVKEGIRTILHQLAFEASLKLKDPFLEERWRGILEHAGAFGALQTVLSLWAEQHPRPLVLFIDEIDTLVGDTLISVLRQLRSGYTNRPALFPQSILLCGVRDVRDYRIHSSREKSIITGGSAFNIKAKSLRLGDFSQDEVNTLFAVHTQETGQVFTPETMQAVWQWSEGQPWLVNALGEEACFEMKSHRNRSLPITLDVMEQARENLIIRQETHLDQLADQLKEERVHRVIAPILAGIEQPKDFIEADLSYVRDLGLVKTDGIARIANPIYREVIPRALTYGTQVSITHETTWYIGEDGKLDMHKLLEAFQDFFRKNSEHWVERFDYKEAGPQLLMQAFLQRILNRDGRIHREYGLGRTRTDLLITWPYSDRLQQVVIELKIRYGSLDAAIQDGLAQTWGYMDKCGAEEGHLIIFDRSPERNWEEKIFCRQEIYHNRKITVWGM